MNEQNAVVPFNFKGNDVRVITRDQEPWFVANDVCDVLELGNPRTSLALLDDDEKGVHTVDTLGGAQKVSVVNEPGLYSLILRSRKPEAKAFKRWVTHEVLPTIRKTGKYQLPKQKKSTVVPVDREFRAALRMAKAVGLTGNQAILSASKLAKKITGQDPLQLLDEKLVAAKQIAHCNPTELGSRFGRSGKRMNQLLAAYGLQQMHIVNGKKVWRPTEKGKKYAVLIDSGKRHDSGAMIQQLRWTEDVLEHIHELYEYI